MVGNIFIIKTTTYRYLCAKGGCVCSCSVDLERAIWYKVRRESLSVGIVAFMTICVMVLNFV
jgi:hypothetical protein